MIRIPQKVHGFSDLSRIFQPTFSIYKFLWIPVKNVLFFATVLVSIIFFDVNFFERSRIFIAKWAFLFTKVQYVTVIGVNFINNVVFYSVVTRFFFMSGFLSKVLAIHGTAGEGSDYLYLPLQFPPFHEHSDIYLQLCIWGEYSVFLIDFFLDSDSFSNCMLYFSSERSN